MIFLTSAIVWSFATMITAIPIDNGLIGEPLIECAVDAIGVNFQTRNPFSGHVYVNGFYADSQCRTDSEKTLNQALIRVRLDTCGIQRLRSISPPGLYNSVTVVIMFHPFFITKVDRAFNVQCFYTESTKIFTQQIDVSMLSTEVKAVEVPMPVCRYEVLNFEQTYGPYLAPIRFARVGQPVLHKWQCDAEKTNVYCMLVHSCTVDDGAGNSVQLLDEIGCAVDRYLLGNLEYPEELMSQRESHVFKYADKTQVYFQCQITLTYKYNLSGCPRPVCPELNRGKRSKSLTLANGTTASGPYGQPAGTLDVGRVFAVLDMDSDEYYNNNDNSSNIKYHRIEPYHRFAETCLPLASFGLLLSLTFLVLSVASLFVIKNKLCDSQKYKTKNDH